MADAQLTEAITQEIAKAITKLGGDPEGVNLSDSWQVNRVLALPHITTMPQAISAAMPIPMRTHELCL
jgi:hypothetical protein